MEVIKDIVPVQKRILLCRIIFSFILFTLIYEALSNTLFHQLQSPVLKYPYVDPAFWLMHLLHIPDIIVSDKTLSYVFDVLLFISCAGCIVFPFSRLLILGFMVIYFVYFITYNSYGAHHTHSGIGILLIPLPFLFRSTTTFSFLWQGLRYYLLFVYADAFLWKLLRGSFLNPHHGLLMLKNNLATYLYYNPGTVLSNFYWWLLNNPFWTDMMYIGGFIIEGFFIIGFFTKKYDKYLLAFSILMVVGFWLLADALFFKLMVLSFTLINYYKKDIRY